MLPEEVHLQIQALADTNQVSSAWVIRMAVQRFLDEFQGQLELPLIRPGFRRHSRPSLRVAPFKLYRGQVAS